MLINQALNTFLSVTSTLNPLAALPPALREAVERVRDHILSGKGVYVPHGLEEAVRVPGAQGDRYFLPRGAPAHDEDGVIIGAALVLQDMTRLRRFDELRTNLVATVAHEFRTPLTSLHMAIHLCLEEVVGPVTDKQQELLFGARGDCERLQNMVHDLLQLSRLETDILTIKPHSVEAATLLHEGTEQSRVTQNGNQAYGPKTARLLQAQWHVEAVSGVGVYRNLGDTVPPTQPAMPALFGQTFLGAAAPSWDFSLWTPDVVVVALGTNDSNSDGSNTVGSNRFRAAYSALVQNLRAHHPNAHIFCLSPFAAGAAAFRQDVQAVVTTLADARVHHLDPVGDVPGTDNVTSRPWLDGANGSDYVDGTHPTAAGHTKIASKLSVEIGAKLAW